MLVKPHNHTARTLYVYLLPGDMRARMICGLSADDTLKILGCSDSIQEINILGHQVLYSSGNKTKLSLKNSKVVEFLSLERRDSTVLSPKLC